MRKFGVLALTLAMLGLTGSGSAFAGGAGGMGDPSAHMRKMQEICDMQRRGEVPNYHTACLPDDPPGYSQPR